MPWWVAWPSLVLALSIFGSVLASRAILFNEYARFEALAENPDATVCLWSQHGKIKFSEPHEATSFLQMVIQGETLLPLGRGDYTPPVDPVIGISFRGRHEIYSLGHGGNGLSEYRLMLGYQPGSDRGHVLRRFLSPPLGEWLENHYLPSRQPSSPKPLVRPSVQGHHAPKTVGQVP